MGRGGLSLEVVLMGPGTSALRKPFAAGNSAAANENLRGGVPSALTAAAEAEGSGPSELPEGADVSAGTGCPEVSREAAAGCDPACMGARHV